MSGAADHAPLGADDARALLDDLRSAPALILAVSGGPDSTALLVIAARWRASLRKGPKLVAVTIDHGLRPESAAEARDVASLARALKVSHRILRWTGPKPKTGIQEAARAARYRLLAKAARQAGAQHILTAHTEDDQAETVLFRMARGSGLTGLAGMARESPLEELPGKGGADGHQQALVLVRPLLTVAKGRLVATLKAAKIDFVYDPSNADPRFARPRWRALMPGLAEEGLDARRVAVLARRLARADAALAAATEEAMGRLVSRPTSAAAAAVISTGDYAALPSEVALRVLGRMIQPFADEGPVALGKLEALHEGLLAILEDPSARFRRTLAGALVSRVRNQIAVSRAPERRNRANQAAKGRRHA